MVSTILVVLFIQTSQNLYIFIEERYSRGSVALRKAVKCRRRLSLLRHTVRRLPLGPRVDQRVDVGTHFRVVSELFCADH